MASVLQSQGKWDEAIACYRRAVEVAPGNNYSRDRLAWILLTCADLKLRNPAEAMKLARNNVAKAPKAVLYWQTLAWGGALLITAAILVLNITARILAAWSSFKQ